MGYLTCICCSVGIVRSTKEVSGRAHRLEKARERQGGTLQQCRGQWIQNQATRGEKSTMKVHIVIQHNTRAIVSYYQWGGFIK